METGEETMLSCATLGTFALGGVYLVEGTAAKKARKNIVKQAEYEGIFVVAVEGRLTMADGTAHALTSLLRNDIGLGVRFLVLNLASVTYADSLGLGEIVNAMTMTRMRAGRFVLICGGRVKDLLHVTRLESVIDFAPDVPAALEMLLNRPIEEQPALEYKEKFSSKSDSEERTTQSVPTDGDKNLTRAESATKARALPLALTALAMFVIMLVALVWAAKQIPSALQLSLIFSVAILFYIIGFVFMLSWSGYLTERTVGQLLKGVLGKVPGLRLPPTHKD